MEEAVLWKRLGKEPPPERDEAPPLKLAPWAGLASEVYDQVMSCRDGYGGLSWPAVELTIRRLGIRDRELIGLIWTGVQRIEETVQAGMKKKAGGKDT